MSLPENQSVTPLSDQFESAFEERFYNERLEKLEKIAALGAASGLKPLEATYPNAFRFQPEGIDVPQIRSLYSYASAEELEAQKPQVAIAGRIVAIRLQGKAGFATLLQNGERLQLYVRKDDVGESAFELYKLLDLGDHVGASGALMRTRTGELTLKVATLTFLAKAMLPLPDKHSGLGDIELRYRRRYLDLFTDTGDVAEAPATPEEASNTPENAPKGTEEAANTPKEVLTGTADVSNEAADVLKGTGFSPSIDSPDKTGALAPEGLAPEPTITRRPAREVFLKRAAVLRALRHFFDSRGYIEVETPMLHTVAGGAAARTFDTHHNAEDMKLNLRIAPELYLKRLVVGGFDRVYEINRNFRNEGVDRSHNPEFTMLEFYQAYANYHDLMDLTEELITFVAKEVNGTTITNFNGTDIDLSKWTKLSMREAIIKFWLSDMLKTPTLADLCSKEFFAEFLKANAVLVNPDHAAAGEEEHLAFGLGAWCYTALERLHNEAYGKLIAELFEILAEEHLIQPHIIYDFPLAVSPLSKVKPDEPEWVERFEFYIGGFEVGNAFSELNDPTDQRKRFLAQLEEKARGDEETMDMDEDYVRALGYGLPPTAGEGIGVDRLTMLLTGSRSIRDVILFPLMRPQTKATAQEDHTHGESTE